MKYISSGEGGGDIVLVNSLQGENGRNCPSIISPGEFLYGGGGHVP